MEKSAQVVGIYLQYMAPEDIHVYSVDEVLLDLTPYLKSYGWSAHTMVRKMIRSVLRETGITATAGIGTNLYLCKVAMDIVAKHMEPDREGVRIASLTEQAYREKLWDHCPLTDFWRIGPGITRKLRQYGMYTMGAVARMSLQDPDLLYHLFGLGTLHPPGYPGLSTPEQQPGVGPGAPAALRQGKGPSHRLGNGGSPGPGPGEEKEGDGPAGAHSGL